jgi:hypothetical protein
LWDVFEAVSAYVVMIVAQFGLPESSRRNSELQSVFQFTAVPAWKLSEVYIFPYDSGNWTPVHFKF